jgi:hypothetical protein
MCSDAPLFPRPLFLLYGVSRPFPPSSLLDGSPVLAYHSEAMKIGQAKVKAKAEVTEIRKDAQFSTPSSAFSYLSILSSTLTSASTYTFP